MKYKIYFLGILTLFFVQASYALADDRWPGEEEKPYVKTAIIKLVKSNEPSTLELDVTRRVRGEWQGWYDYVVLRVYKKKDTKVDAKITSERLGYCKVVDNVQLPYWSDVIVSFDAENDGGYNSCDVTLTNKNESRVVEIGAEVGE